MVNELNQQTFAATINESKKCLVDFWAPWCGPCRAQAPALEQLSATAQVYKVNVDENPQLAQQFGIASIPTLLVFENGNVTKRASGLHSLEQLKTLLG